MKKIQLVLLLIPFLPVFVSAQTFFNIKKYDGLHQYANVESVRKLLFNENGDTLSIVFKTGTIVTDALPGVQSFTFGNSGLGMLISVDKQSALIPLGLELQQNYPNPFNPTTRITFYIPEKSMVSLKVYDVLGVEIVTLVNESMHAGQYSREFNAGNIPSGVYFYTLSAGQRSVCKKMLVLK